MQAFAQYMTSTGNDARGWRYSHEAAMWALLVTASIAASLIEPLLAGALVVIIIARATLRMVWSGGGLRTLPLVIFMLAGLGGYAALALRSDTAWWGITGSSVETTSVLALAAAALAIVLGEACARRWGASRILDLAAIVMPAWGAAFLICYLSGVPQALALPDSGVVFVIGLVAAGVRAARTTGANRVLYGLAATVSGIVFALGVFGAHPHAMSVAVQDRIPSLYQTYQIATSVWSLGYKETFVGLGARRFADAWHAHRPWETNVTGLWNQEPQHGGGLLLSVAIEYGMLGLLLIVAPIVVVASSLLSQRFSLAAAGGFGIAIALLAVSVPTTLGLVIGALALGAAAATAAAPRESMLLRSVVSMGALVPLFMAVWFLLALIAASILIRDMSIRSLDHVEFSRASVVHVFGMPAPFATVYELEAGVWREYVRARIASGVPVVVSTSEHAYDLLFDLHARIDRADDARSGIRLALLDAQIALWSAGEGYSANLAETRVRLSRLVETQAPMHIVAQLLLAEIQKVQGDAKQADWFRRYASYLRPQIESEPRALDEARE